MLGRFKHQPPAGPVPGSAWRMALPVGRLQMAQAASAGAEQRSAQGGAGAGSCRWVFSLHRFLGINSPCVSWEIWRTDLVISSPEKIDGLTFHRHVRLSNYWRVSARGFRTWNIQPAQKQLGTFNPWNRRMFGRPKSLPGGLWGAGGKLPFADDLPTLR